MSSSTKKKLRNAQDAEKMTEKQKAEQKEAKKLKIYTAAFVIVLALMVAFAAWTAISKFITHSGIVERNTTALTVNDHKISNAEMNYFFIDAVNNFYNQYGSYASMFGLDVTKPLDEQVTDEEAGTTWADDFLQSAINSAKSVYALVDEAKANGYTLNEEQQAYVDLQMSNMQTYANHYGYSVGNYLKAVYGNGATEKSLRNYYENTYLAQCYQTDYVDGLTYDDAAIEAESTANYAEYCSYSYNYYFLNVNSFLTGGTTDEEGNTTYSDEEKAAAVDAAEAAAKELAGTAYENADAFDAAIAAMPINADAETPAASTAQEDVAYSKVLSTIRDWVADTARKSGDITYLASTSTSTDDDGNETTTTTGYYVVLFGSANDNEYPLANVRHILVKFQGGTKDGNGNTTYSDEEKNAAKATAEALLTEWKNGDANEESFAALAGEKSEDPGSSENGGLYEDVYPGQMVANFNDWCFADGRKAGDAGIVESTYGYHVMFYSGDSETTYRDYLVTKALRSTESETWYNNLLDNAAVTEGSMKYLKTDLVLSSN